MSGKSLGGGVAHAQRAQPAGRAGTLAFCRQQREEQPEDHVPSVSGKEGAGGIDLHGRYREASRRRPAMEVDLRRAAAAAAAGPVVSLDPAAGLRETSDHSCAASIK